MLKPAAGGAIRRALVGRGNVPLPEEGYDLIIKGTTGTGLEGNRCIGSLFDGRLGSSSSPVFDIPLALPSGFGTTGAVGGFEIALGHSLFSGVALGDGEESWGWIAYANFAPFASGAAFGSTGNATHVGLARLTSHSRSEV